jgi:Cys-tRNA synthase (O-phospho-L-seryl-tRNA:Cys-tRNA synthase)
MFPAFHEVNGIDNSFMWGGRKLNNYKIVIKPDNTAYYYDFSNAKKDEIRESQQTLKCKKETFNLEKEEFQNYTNSFKNIFNKYGFNLD